MLNETRKGNPILKPAQVPPLDALAEEVRAVFQRKETLADEKPVTVFPRPDDLRSVIVPLLERCRARRPSEARGLVGIVAPPGGGKSLFTAWLAATAKALGWKEFGFLALDGYHLPNAVLDARTGADSEGNILPLRLLKGSPATFDAERLLADLRTLKADRAELRFPAYSRTLHEPVPDRLRIGPEVEWVFVEGNYLFLSQPTWRNICSLLELKIYLDADDNVLLDRLKRRHATGGRDTVSINAHMHRTDRPNIRLIRSSAAAVDVRLLWDGAGRLSLSRASMPLRTDKGF